MSDWPHRRQSFAGGSSRHTWQRRRGEEQHERSKQSEKEHGRYLHFQQRYALGFRSALKPSYKKTPGGCGSLLISLALEGYDAAFEFSTKGSDFCL